LDKLNKITLAVLAFSLSFISLPASANSEMVNGVMVRSGSNGPGMTGFYNGHVLRVYNNTSFSINCEVVLGNVRFTTGSMISTGFTDIPNARALQLEMLVLVTFHHNNDNKEKQGIPLLFFVYNIAHLK